MRRVRQCISSTIILRSNLQREEVTVDRLRQVRNIFPARSFCSSRLTSFARCRRQSPPMMEDVQTPETEIRKNRKKRTERKEQRERRGEYWRVSSLPCNQLWQIVSAIPTRPGPPQNRDHTTLIAAFQAMGFSASSFVGSLRSIATS